MKVLLRLGACLSVGAVATVGMAWGLSLRGTVIPGSTRGVESPIGGPFPLAAFGPIAGFIDPEWRPTASSPGYGVWAVIERDRGFGLDDEQASVMITAGDGMTGNEVASVHAAGWPLPALWCANVRRGRSWVWEHSRPTPASLARKEYLAGTPVPRPPLPLRPKALGFAADTMFFGAPVFVVLSGSEVCRLVRRRRGRCPSCGYDRAGLAEGAACPECGRPVL